MSDERKYQPIWDALKTKGHGGSISISAHSKFHARIVKAVKKEKWMDVGYKLSIEPKIAFLSHSRTHNMLTFHLALQSRPDGRVHTFDPSNI